MANRANASKLIQKFQDKYNVKRKSEKLSLPIYGAYFNLFYERGIYDEKPFAFIRKEIQKKEKLINYLHGLYIVLRDWFGSDMIMQHDIFSKIESKKEYPEIPFWESENDYSPEELEKMPSIIVPIKKYISIQEYKYSRGISEIWYTDMMSCFNENKEFEYYDNVDYTVKVDGESKNISPIAKIKLPQKITEFFKELHSDLLEIITRPELDELLNLLDLSWTLKEWLDIRDLHTIDLKTHLIYSNLKDIDHLMKVTTHHECCYEPFYLTCLEQIGEWGCQDYSKVSEIYAKSYLTIEKYVSKYKDLPPCPQKLPSMRLNDWPKGEYPYHSNKISLGMVSNECRKSVMELTEYLCSIDKDYSKKFMWVNFLDDINANRDYIKLLKKFKTLAINVREPQKSIRKTSNTANSAIIGYDDIKKYIKKRLEPYKNPKAEKFGIKKLAGIMLYGPPGCGITYWANQIAKYLKLELEEIPRSVFGSSYVDGAMKGLENKLNEIEKFAPRVIFFDEFDSIGTARNSDSVVSEENRKVVNTLLQKIPKLIEKGIVIIAATNFINDLDSALIRPGRFDLHIPILQPLPHERAELILQNLTENAEDISRILAINSSDQIEFWLEYTESMYLFSNSYVIDFCKELRDYLYYESLNAKSGSKRTPIPGEGGQ